MRLTVEARERKHSSQTEASRIDPERPFALPVQSAKPARNTQPAPTALTECGMVRYRSVPIPRRATSVTDYSNCPNKESHTPMPTGYLAWHELVYKMKRTHRQIKCPGCGLFKILIPK